MPYFTKKKFYLAQTGVGVPVQCTFTDIGTFIPARYIEAAHNFKTILATIHSIHSLFLLCKENITEIRLLYSAIKLKIL